MSEEVSFTRLVVGQPCRCGSASGASPLRLAAALIRATPSPAAITCDGDDGPTKRLANTTSHACELRVPYAHRLSAAATIQLTYAGSLVARASRSMPRISGCELCPLLVGWL